MLHPVLNIHWLIACIIIKKKDFSSEKTVQNDGDMETYHLINGVTYKVLCLFHTS